MTKRNQPVHYVVLTGDQNKKYFSEKEAKEVATRQLHDAAKLKFPVSYVYKLVAAFHQVATVEEVAIQEREQTIGEALVDRPPAPPQVEEFEEEPEEVPDEEENEPGYDGPPIPQAGVPRRGAAAGARVRLQFADPPEFLGFDEANVNQVEVRNDRR